METKETPEILRRCEKLLKILHIGMHEREDAIRLGFLSAVAGESLFMLGPPGVAKSLTARRLKYMFVPNDTKDRSAEEIRHFEYLMGKFSTPEELFGPISVQALKEDRYERKVEGYLPKAHIVFLDGIWKAGPAIQNTLLTVLNEKVYRNGPQEEKIPLELLVAASNELPAPGMGLEALWDRFLVRLWVDNIKDEEKLLSLLGGASDPYRDPFAALDAEQKNLRLSLAELRRWREECSGIEVPEKIRRIVLQVKKRLQQYNENLKNLQVHAEKETESSKTESSKAESPKESTENNENPETRPFYLSDRRMLKMVHILRASAFVHGRKEVNQCDLLLLPYFLWDTEEQIAPAKRLVAEILENHAFSAGDFEKELRTLEKDIRAHLEEYQKAKEHLGKVQQKAFDGSKGRLLKELGKLRQNLAEERQKQMGHYLFAGKDLRAPLEKSFQAVEAKLDSLEKSLGTGTFLNLGTTTGNIHVGVMAGISPPQNTASKKPSITGPWAGKKPSPSDLQQICASHAEWLNSAKTRGARAELQGANLEGANLQKNLQGVNI